MGNKDFYPLWSDKAPQPLAGVISEKAKLSLLSGNEISPNGISGNHVRNPVFYTRLVVGNKVALAKELTTGVVSEESREGQYFHYYTTTTRPPLVLGRPSGEQ